MSPVCSLACYLLCCPLIRLLENGIVLEANRNNFLNFVALRAADFHDESRRSIRICRGSSVKIVMTI